MIKELIDRLNSLCSTLDYEYYINSGGCCYVAWILSELCEQHNIPYKVHVMDDCGCFDVQEFHCCVNNRSTCEECLGLFEDVCCHYFISIDNTYINEGGFGDEIFDVQLNSKDLEWIYDTGHWNPEYNSDHNTFIASCLSEIFNEVISKGD